KRRSSGGWPDSNRLSLHEWDQPTAWEWTRQPATGLEHAPGGTPGAPRRRRGSVTGWNSVQRMPGRLPGLDRFDRMDEHDDVQREIVAHPEQAEDLHGQNRGDAEPDPDAAGEDEAERHHDDVAARIENAVPDVAQRDGRLAVAVDDERRVLQHFP